MVPTFVVYPFRLLLALGDRRSLLPPYLGSTVRGVFAASFRKLVCATGAPVCEGCLLIDRCPYPYIFETPSPHHIPEPLQRRFRQAPRPYVLDVPLAYAGEAELELGLVLVGRAVDFLPYFIYVMEEVGKKGIGRARVPYRLLSVADGSRDGGPVIFHSAERIVREDFHGVILEALPREGDERVTRVTLEFLTPLRVKKYGGYQESGERMTFATLMDLLLGRIEALSFFHCGGEWAPHEGLRAKAQDVRVVAKNLSLQRLERYSNRRQQRLPLHGLVGTLTVEGELTEFLPLLRMGEYIHIGEGTAFGLGRYRLQHLS